MKLMTVSIITLNGVVPFLYRVKGEYETSTKRYIIYLENGDTHSMPIGSTIITIHKENNQS